MPTIASVYRKEGFDYAIRAIQNRIEYHSKMGETQQERELVPGWDFLRKEKARLDKEPKGWE